MSQKKKKKSKEDALMVRVHYSYVERKTEKALLVHLCDKDEPEWFPKSEILEHNIFENWLEIPLWLARRKGIEFERPTPAPIPQGLNHKPIYARERRKNIKLEK